MDIVERLRESKLIRLSTGVRVREEVEIPLHIEAADEIERLEKENELLQKELKKHLTYQDHRHGRIGTHDPICYEYGPRHYECALREIDRLREERNQLRKVLLDVLAKEYVADCKDVARAALKEGE